jgi:hypothetical protein
MASLFGSGVEKATLIHGEQVSQFDSNGAAEKSKK